MPRVEVRGIEFDTGNYEVAEYESHPDDPPALLIDCPVCVATVGFWCGGFGDIHSERADAVK